MTHEGSGDDEGHPRGLTVHTTMIDTLRAENERLTKDNEQQARKIHRLAAECVERLEDQERLRAALEKIAQWDCLNPPVSHITCVRDASDFTWLRGVVDEALRPT